MKYGFKPLEGEVVHNIDREVENEEIKEALFDMGAWKAPGPDGYPAGFYQKNWSIIATKLYEFVRHLWKTPYAIANVNTTDICLIPKIDKPEFVSQFRPISLCNVSYKVLTKVIVNRLKPLMPTIISPYQTGFVPTRSIHENIVVAQEMVHTMYKMRGRTGFIAIKVDLAKAYDRLRWSFISAVLEEVNLPQGLRNIIMNCITSVKTNVMWHGSRSDFFTPGRGIRQGDPMSPYIFVLCMDKLTHLIAESVDSENWHPLKVGRSRPPISHLMFADDLL
ncbi:ribonuclease H, partial [Trifolium pratense]